MEVLTPEERLVTGNPYDDIQILIYHMHPGLVTARHLIDPVIWRFMSGLKEGESVEQEDRRMQEFLPKCFEATCDDLMNSIDPIDDEVQNAFGLAVEAFPHLLPKAFTTLRKILKRMAARYQVSQSTMDEEEEEEQFWI